MLIHQLHARRKLRGEEIVDDQTPNEGLVVKGCLQYECSKKEREVIRCDYVVDFYVAKLLNL